MMEATSTSETSVNFYQTTRRNNSEDSHLHTRRRENLKSHTDTENLRRYSPDTMSLSLSSANNFLEMSEVLLAAFLI
jgi:hypothetical protein